MRRWWAVVVVACVSAGRVVEARDFKYLGYGAIEAKLQEFAESPLVEVTTAQERYGLPSAGTCKSGEPCKQYIVHVTNFATYDADVGRPEVFFSGELHGDERVGPTATVEFVQLLLDQYATYEWVRRLVDTRSIWVMPTPNAHGYFEGRRTELGVDVNRDFPVDKSTGDCMASVAARALNELFRERLFRVAITFHSGIEMITYTWGTVTALQKRKHRSPDDISQAMMGSSMSAFAGKFEGHHYPHGRMNDLLYPVRGGMEDWAYASSLPVSGHTVTPCSDHADAYPVERTTYDSMELRVQNYLVETSAQKSPAESSLGSDANMLDPNDAGTGHVPRNVRLMLMTTDMAEPYIAVDSVDSAAWRFTYEVGGALNVDKTWAVYTFVKTNGARVTKKTKARKGRTRWSGGSTDAWKRKSGVNKKHQQGRDIALQADLSDRSAHPVIAAFTAQLGMPASATLEKVRIVAGVDAGWGKKRSGAYPKNVAPQSHLVRSRVDKKWLVEKGGRKIQGKVVFDLTLCFDAEREQVDCE